MAEGTASEPFVNEDLTPDRDAGDVAVLLYYMEGNLRSDRTDPGRIRRLKDAGFLTCTVDASTGGEYLKTTPSGYYDTMLSNPMSPEDTSAARTRILEILGR